MKYLDFKRAIEEGKDFYICLFEGEDNYFKKRGLELLKNTFLSEQSLNFSTFEGDVTGGDLLSSLEAYPFMSKKRITLVNDFYPSGETLKIITNYSENPVDYGILVIINQKPFEKLKKLKNLTVIDCSKSDSATISRWIKGRCAKDGVVIDNQTAALLAEYCLLDMARIETETQKLIDYVYDKKVIDTDDINLLVNRDSEYKIYELTEHVGKKKFNLALNVITEMKSKGETSQRLLISIYNYFRKLLLTATSGKSANEIASLFEIKEYPAKKIKQQSDYFKKKSLKKAVDFLTDADFNFKSGKKDIEEEFWLCFFKIVCECEK